MNGTTQKLKGVTLDQIDNFSTIPEQIKEPTKLKGVTLDTIEEDASFMDLWKQEEIKIIEKIPALKYPTKYGKEFQKGIIGSLARLPQAGGALLQEMGETMGIKPHPMVSKTLDILTMTPQGMPFKGMVEAGKLKNIVAEKTQVDEFITKKAKSLIAANQRFVKLKGLEADPDDKIAQFIYNLGSGVTSLAGAMGLTVLTKNPSAAAIAFGVYQKGQIYQEAREAGKKPIEASILSTVAGGVEAGLEYVGLDFMFRKFGSRLVGVASRIATEAMQEWSQQTGENFIAKYGWDKARGLTRGSWQAALIGGILGGGASVVIDSAQTEISKDIPPELQTKVIEAQKEALANEVEKIIQEEIPETTPLQAEGKGIVVRPMEIINSKSNKGIDERLKDGTEDDLYIFLKQLQDAYSNIKNPSSRQRFNFELSANAIKEAIRDKIDIRKGTVQRYDVGFGLETKEETLARRMAYKKSLAQVPKSMEGLENEARKYKTAEEFVESLRTTEKEIPTTGKTGYVFIDESVKNGESEILYIKPDDFISIMAKETRNEPNDIIRNATRKVIDKYKNKIKAGEKIDTPFIEFGKVQEDGVHRVLAMKELGYKKVPVILNKSQLTDFWNKSQSLPKGEEGGKIPPLPTLAQRLEAIQKEYKTDTAKTKQEIKAVQTEIIEKLEVSDLEAKDKAKFIRTIKNIQTAEQLTKALPEIRNRVSELVDKQVKRDVKTQIDRELKYTKPVKKGDKRIGKYDYQTNKYFDDIRGLSKLNQEKAQSQLDEMGEPTNMLDLIKTRFLSLQANGMKGSSQLYEQVLRDIKFLKQEGNRSKSESDFLDRVKRTQDIDNALEVIRVKKDTKDSIITRAFNLYRKGFSNNYSMLNSVFNKQLAEKYDPQIAENRKDTAIFNKTRIVASEVGKIYDLPKNVNVNNKLFEMMQETYDIADLEGLTRQVTKLDLIDIYNALKNDMTQERYYNAYGKDQIDALMGNLTTQDKAFGDSLQKTAQEYRDIFNARSIEITGRDMGIVKNYWPATSEHKADIYDDYHMQGETPSAMKERAKSVKVIPIHTNAILKTFRHITQGEHIRHLSKSYENLKRLLTDRKIKYEIEQKYGKDVYRTMLDQTENISLNKETEHIDAVSGAIGAVFNNWVTAKIGLNPSVFAKQLLSVINYSEDMNSAEWTQLFAEGLSHPKETFDYMWKNAPFLEARFHRGYSEAIASTLGDVDLLQSKKKGWAHTLSALVRTGDIGAIVYGGYPYVKSLEKTMTKQEAFDKFELATLTGQQSRLSSSRSQFQNSRNPMARFLLAFKNTANQYFRKQMDAIISYRQGDITKGQLAKTTMIYSVIQPILYSFAGVAMRQAWKELGGLFGGDGGDDDFWEMAFHRVMTQLAINPFQAIPILDEMSEWGVREISGQENWWGVFSTPLLSELDTSFSKLGKEEKTAYDIADILGTIVELSTGTPVKMPVRIFKYMFEDKKETNKKGKSRI